MRTNETSTTESFGDVKIAVTGAGGHVGGNVVRTLLEAGHEVVALCRNDTRAIEGLKVTRVSGDVLDPPTLEPAFAGADAVIHTAGRISIEGDADGSVRAVNVDGTRNVIDAALAGGIGRLVHFSSFHAFRQAPYEEPLTEERPPVGSEGFPYDRSKAAGEREVLAGVERGLEAVILNPTAIVGPHDFKPSLMGQVLLDLARGALPAIVPGGSDWVDVRDVAGAAVAALDRGRPGERYLLSGRWTSVTHLAGLAEAVTGTPRPRLTVPLWLARIGVPFARIQARMTATRPVYTHESLDRLVRSSRDVLHEKARRELGFDPRPLEETLADSYAWFRAAGMLG